MTSAPLRRLIELFAVTMRQKRASLLVEQQAMEMTLQLLLLQSQLFLNLAGKRFLGESLPLGVIQRELARPQPPDAANARVDERLLPLAVGSWLLVRFQIFRLGAGQRQTNRPRPSTSNPGRTPLDMPADTHRMRQADQS